MHSCWPLGGGHELQHCIATPSTDPNKNGGIETTQVLIIDPLISAEGLEVRTHMPPSYHGARSSSLWGAELINVDRNSKRHHFLGGVRRSGRRGVTPPWASCTEGAAPQAATDFLHLGKTMGLKIASACLHHTVLQHFLAQDVWQKCPAIFQ